MHIALIRQHFDQRHGGAERYAVSLAHALVGRGHKVSVICSRASRDDAHGINIVKIGRGKWAGFMRHMAFAWQAGRAAKKLGADQVISLARAFPADIHRLGDPLHSFWLRLRSGGPLLARKALRNPRHRALVRLEEKLFTPGAISQFITNSELVKRQVTHLYGVDPERIHVFRNPVDTQRFNPEHAEERGQGLRRQLGIAPDEMVILFSGMEYRRKGLDQAARAFVALVRGAPDLRDKFRFLVVGRGSAESAKNILTAAGCAQRMIVLPQDDSIERCYGAANVFVLPTAYDPAANAVSEALACGTPVVTTSLNGSSELIRDGANGMALHDRDDTEGWAAAITQLLATERIQRSRQYVAMVRRAPSWNDHVDGWLELLQARLTDKIESRLTPPRNTASLRERNLVGRGELQIRNAAPNARYLLERIDDEVLDQPFAPASDMVIKSHNSSTVARFRVRGYASAKSPLFAPPHPKNVFLKVARDDPAAGPHEYDICEYCVSQGIPAMQALAAGSDGRKSYVLTAEAPGQELQDFISQHCRGNEPQRVMLRARLIEAVADLASTFHQSGLNHRDFYSNHIRVCLNTDGSIRLTLIDLQRVQRRPKVPLRWRIKDLGQLSFSLSKELVSSTDRLRFLRRYCWNAGLSVPRRRLLKLIQARVAFIESRHEKVVAARKKSDASLNSTNPSDTQYNQDELVPATKADLTF